MKIFDTGDVRLHYRVDGPEDGAPVVFANSLGTDLRLWDPILPLLPKGLRIIRFDKRGHGLSSCPPAPYAMGALIGDTEKLLDHLGVKDCVFVGLSIGGMIAQGLATKRLDLIRAMVLSNTAAKIGTKDMWADRVRAVQESGIEPMADTIMERWFAAPSAPRPSLNFGAIWSYANRPKAMPVALPRFRGPISTPPRRRCACQCWGSRAPKTGPPPDLVRETIELIPGSKFKIIRKAGHLPCVEHPQEYAALLTEFLQSVGHV